MAADRKNAIDGRNKLHAKTFLSGAQIEILQTIAKGRTAAQVRAQEIRTNRALEQILETAEAEAAHRQALFGDEEADDGTWEAPAQPVPSGRGGSKLTSDIAELPVAAAPSPKDEGKDRAAKDGFDEVYAEIFGD